MLLAFAWRALVISGLWLGLTELADWLFWNEPAEVSKREFLVALGAGHFLVAVNMIHTEAEKRTSL